jgi:hypothetical protein
MLTELGEIVSVGGCINSGVSGSHRLAVCRGNGVTLRGPEPNDSKLAGLEPVQLLRSGLVSIIVGGAGVDNVVLLQGRADTLRVNGTGNDVVLVGELTIFQIRILYTVILSAKQRVVIQVDLFVASVIDLDVVEAVVRMELGVRLLVNGKIVESLVVRLGVDHDLGYDQIHVVIVGGICTVKGLNSLIKVSSKCGYSNQ